MRVVRRLEDFDGLENNFGLKIKISNGNDLYLQDGNSENIKVGYYDVKENGLYNIIRVIKLMGFEFEWKPKFGEDEILDKYEPNKFEKDVFKYRIWFNGKNYSYVYDDEFGVFGYCYYNKKTAEEICEKLNS